MRSSYTHALPEVFPYVITLTNKSELWRLVNILIDRESSFSVTVDRPFTLWMSEASYQYIMSAAAMEEKGKTSGML